MLTIKPMTEELAVSKSRIIHKSVWEIRLSLLGQQMTKNNLFVRLLLSLKML